MTSRSGGRQNRYRAELVRRRHWVEPSDSQPLTAAGQVFRMGMYHPNHPDGNYQMANRVEAFDPPHAISWQPGTDSGFVTA
jgi:hypothetical protein